MSWKDKLFGSRIFAVGKREIRKADGTTITVRKDIRYTVKDGSSTIHMYDLDDVKSYCKHNTRLDGYLDEAYVLSIYETEIDEETTLSEIQLLDAEDNNYYCFSLCAYDDVYEGDIVSVYALPIGETSFENIGGGTTLAIVLAGCYIEKLEVE